MPHLPVIANVFRVTLEWNTVNGVTPRNVMHFKDGSGAASVTGVLNTVKSHFQADQFLAMKDSYQITSVTGIKLDGSSGSVTVDSTAAANNTGGSTGAIIPAESAVIKLATGLRGRDNRGRVFVGPVTENSSEAGLLVESIRTAMTGAWVDFAIAMAGDNIALGVASYRHTHWNQVLDLVCRSRVGSTRRRLDQLALA